MASVGDAISVLNVFWTTYNNLKTNREECRRLHKHAHTVLAAIKEEHKRSVPPGLNERLAKFIDTLDDLISTIEDLKRSSILKQIFMASDISALITRAYEDIDLAAKGLQLGMHLDIYKAQAKHEEARKADSERADYAFEAILTNEGSILKELAEHRIEMQEAILFIRKNLSRGTQGQRRALEKGMRLIQRRSRDRLTGLQVPEEFVITSLEIVVHRHMKLGAGGFAEVYEADWNRTKVAVKIFPTGVISGVLEREFNVWRQLRHPNILEFFGACSFANPPFFVCALKSNGDVMSYLREHPDANRTQLLYDASRGLVYLHTRRPSVVHGDLKGTNILVDERGRACLADFGLSMIKVTTTLGGPLAAQSEPTRGTAQWMSPEVMMGETTTQSSDVYSFAMTMYEVFTDAAPFGNTPEVLLLSVVYDRRVRPKRPSPEKATEVGDQVWTLMEKSWAHEPPERPLADLIAQTLGSLCSTTSRVPSPNEIPTQKAREDHSAHGNTAQKVIGPHIVDSQQIAENPAYRAVDDHAHIDPSAVASTPSMLQHERPAYPRAKRMWPLPRPSHRSTHREPHPSVALKHSLLPPSRSRPSRASSTPQIIVGPSSRSRSASREQPIVIQQRSHSRSSSPTTPVQEEPPQYSELAVWSQHLPPEAMVEDWPSWDYVPEVPVVVQPPSAGLHMPQEVGVVVQPHPSRSSLEIVPQPGVAYRLQPEVDYLPLHERFRQYMPQEVGIVVQPHPSRSSLEIVPQPGVAYRLQPEVDYLPLHERFRQY